MQYTKPLPLNVVIIDGGFHSRMEFYHEFARNKRFNLIKIVSIPQFETEEKMFLNKTDLFIINPTMSDHLHYGGPDNTQHGKLTGLFLHQHKIQGLTASKCFVWSHSEHTILEGWKNNVVEKFILNIDHQKHFLFLPHLEKYFPDHFPKKF